ncbi:MAG: FMN-binding protein [Geodermatophilaceae bacterium]|nr:FMN-binding protein [Geodermatophilaceae bacterium]
MKRVILTILITIAGLVLLLQYKTPAPPALALPPPVASTTAGAGTTPPAAAPPATTSGPAPAQPRTLIGDTIDTEQGPVQVQVTMTGAAITDVTMLQYPNGGGRDQEINSVALPQLVAQALAVQSAAVDMVSGATYTSEGFIQSLQSALDQA